MEARDDNAELKTGTVNAPAHVDFSLTVNIQAALLGGLTPPYAAVALPFARSNQRTAEPDRAR
jgi:hypothetical protein